MTHSSKQRKGLVEHREDMTAFEEADRQRADARFAAWRRRAGTTPVAAAVRVAVSAPRVIEWS